MRLTRSFVAQPLPVGSTIALPEDAAAHLVRVLRLQAGDPCVLFNGDGFDCDARIASVGKREVLADIVASRPVDNESPLAITLLQGIARGEKMDLILQKATELGVTRILPVSSERSEVKLDAQRRSRWRRPRRCARGAASSSIRLRSRHCRRCKAANCLPARWPSAPKVVGHRATANSW